MPSLYLALHIFRNFTTMKKVAVIVFFLTTVWGLSAQDIDPNGFNRFYYPNGNVSAEGNMRDGKPDGYWKNYYEDGTLKSEGNRLYFELDSVWKFYNPDGQIINSITYRQDKKTGYAISYDFYYTEDSSKIYYRASKELFVNGLREGLSFYYDISGYQKFTYNYKFDKRTGEGKEFDKKGTVITLFSYYNGYLVETIRINRTDDKGLKQGRWIDFYENGNKKTEYNYLNDKLHGMLRQYDNSGTLLSETRYLNGEVYVPRVEDEIKLKAEVKKSYFPDGKLQYEGAFINNIPVGIHKEYNQQGKLITAKEYTGAGELLGEGLFDEKGLRTGFWKLYDQYYSYFFGEGNYLNGQKDGKWIFYYPDGKTELEGFYSEGKPDREWLWLYQSGSKKREEVYLNGKREGLYAEYDSASNVILQGEYFDDARVGEWVYQVGDITEKGAYELDEKTGEWKHFYNETNRLRFIGEFKDGDAEGTHKWFFPDGKVELIGTYRVGKKNKDWKRYNPDGSLYMTFTYRNDELIKIDGKNLKKAKGKQ